MHKLWLNEPLEIEPASGGVARKVLNESKIIGNYNTIY